MTIMTLSWATLLAALLAILGGAAAQLGTDSRDSFVDDHRR